MRTTARWKWIAGAGGLCLLGAAMVPWTFSGQAMRLEIARQARDATGLVANAEGRAVLALLPRPRVKFESVSIRDRDGYLRIEAESLRGDLRVWPMLAGRMELASVTLVAPRIDINLDGNPFFEEGMIARVAERGDGASDPRLAERLGVVTLVDGSAVLRSERRRLEARVEALDATIDWRSLGAPAGLKGTFRLNGEPAEVAAWFGQPRDLLLGKSSDVSLKIASPALTLDLDGKLSADGKLVYEGALSASAPGLRALTPDASRPLPVPGRLEDVTISGAARIQSSSASLTDVRLSIDGNAYEGALILDREGARPALSGTLASNSLDFAPLVASLPVIVDPAGDWSRAPLPAPSDTLFDIDLRVSASRARLGRIQFRDAAFSLIRNRDRSEFTLAEAGAFGGAVKGRLSARPKAGGYDFTAEATATRVNPALLPGDLFRATRVSGEASGRVSLVSEGASVAGALRALRGEARLDLGSGDFSGLDLEQALRRLEKRPLSIAAEVRGGRTGFTKASIDLGIAAGMATLRGGASGPGVDFDLTGTLTLPERMMDINLRARLAGAETARENGPQGPQSPVLSMDFSGPWDEPALTLDARSLISRSPAAAPLLRGLAPPAPPAGSP